MEFEQGGHTRAEYGAELLVRLGNDLTKQFGRGFSDRNLLKTRTFFLGWEISPTVSAKLEARVRIPQGFIGTEEKFQTPSGKSEIPPSASAKSEIRSTLSGNLEIWQTLSAKFDSSPLTAFPLSWSQYVRLMSVEKPHARAFYESEAIRGGWSVRQLDRQISTQLFRTNIVVETTSGHVGARTETKA